MSTQGDQLIREYLGNIRAVKGEECADFFAVSGVLAAGFRTLLGMIEDKDRRLVGRDVAVKIHAEVLAQLQHALEISDDDAEEMIQMSGTLNAKLNEIHRRTVQ